MLLIGITVYVITIIKGHCATHLLVAGLLTPFAALQVWHSATVYANTTVDKKIVSKFTFVGLDS